MSAHDEFQLEAWYPSEVAKRNLGSICDAVFLQDKSVFLLGTAAAPLLILWRVAVEQSDEVILIDEARADWSNVTLAASIYGTRFRIQRRRDVGNRKALPIAILCRYPDAKHPAERYFRSSSPDVEDVAQAIEGLAQKVRRLNGNTSLSVA